MNPYINITYPFANYIFKKETQKKTRKPTTSTGTLYKNSALFPNA